jgi:hypothetical protein
MGTKKAAKTTLVIELNHASSTTISLEKPAMFGDFEDYCRAVFAHVLRVIDARPPDQDVYARLAELGEVGVFVQASLTDNRACAFIGEDLGQCWLERRPRTLRGLTCPRSARTPRL